MTDFRSIRDDLPRAPASRFLVLGPAQLAAPAAIACAVGAALLGLIFLCLLPAAVAGAWGVLGLTLFVASGVGAFVLSSRLWSRVVVVGDDGIAVRTGLSARFVSFDDVSALRFDTVSIRLSTRSGGQLELQCPGHARQAELVRALTCRLEQRRALVADVGRPLRVETRARAVRPSTAVYRDTSFVEREQLHATALDAVAPTEVRLAALEALAVAEAAAALECAQALEESTANPVLLRAARRAGRKRRANR